MSFQRLKSFWRDRSGLSAVEFALIAPVLSTVLILGWDGWLMTNQAMGMRTALSTGARYYQIGGSDDVLAQTAALSAWTAKPASGTLSVARSCRCAATVVACSATCAGGVPPMTFITLSATSDFTGALSQRPLSEREVVRVR